MTAFKKKWHADAAQKPRDAAYTQLTRRKRYRIFVAIPQISSKAGKQ